MCGSWCIDERGGHCRRRLPIPTTARSLMSLCFSVSLLLLLATAGSGSRVYELSDKFLELYQKDSRPWLVKFYAPWCHHCKQLEPIYMQVAQKLATDGSDVLVARVDCTRWPAVSNAFPIPGFPTILFISGGSVTQYDGDRVKNEIADFATRMAGPIINLLPDCNQLNDVLERHKVFFLHIGLAVPNYFRQAASKFRSSSWFYHVNATSCPPLTEGTHVVKGTAETRITFKYDEDLWNSSMSQWVKREQFPQFVKVTPSALNRLIRSGKILVMALVEEHHNVEKLASGKDEEMMQLLQAIAFTYDAQEKFIFGWCSHPDLVNSLTVHSATSMPAVVAVNTTDMSYALMAGVILPQDILQLLLRIERGEQEFHGGNTWWIRFKRSLFDAIVSLVNMYHANPILTLLMFGLPLSFFALIVYSTCFSDMLDAPDEDDEEPDRSSPRRDPHEKRD